ncbi:histidine--tRNA ligase [Candidatus Sneabacter namystus]|nr:histidine--tRNA ligase [Candidatus Sneabacter namystus]
MRKVRGTKDIFFDKCRLRKEIIERCWSVSESYGFEPVEVPVLEYEDTYKRTLGEWSDIVSKEMYSFEDKGGEVLTLRPEFTAGIMRAVCSEDMRMPLRLFSHGPLFRYERPQMGRQRQLYQMNWEHIGTSSSYADAELICMIDNILKILNLDHAIKLKINSLGCSESRFRYKNAISQYFERFKDDLSEYSKVRLEKNPLRILDSKDEKDIEIGRSAPSISSYYTISSKQFLEELLSSLTKLGVKYELDETLVRGLDYYNHSVFEFVSDEIGAQAAVCGGGRYDGLSENMGFSYRCSVGAALGLDRICLMIKNLYFKKTPIIFIIPTDSATGYALILADKLRRELNSHYRIVVDVEGTVKRRMKNADNCEAQYVIVLGDQELASNVVRVRDFVTGVEKEVTFDKLCEFFVES